MKAPDTPPRRVALVTGASSGIGKACATELARAGFSVFGGCRCPGHAAAERPFQMLTLDVRDDTSVGRCVESLLSQTGRIDLLVNNAGVAVAGALEETGLADFRNVMETNLFGAVRLMRAVLPAMRIQGSGRIVNIGSMMGFLPMPYSAAYCASKHALRGLSESVDHEVRRFGIRVVIIEPGFIRTGIAQRSPVAASMKPYSSAREFPMRYFRQHVEQGADPIVVARAVVAAATAARPQPRYLPDNYARMMRFMRGVLPSGCFDFGFRRYFRLDSH